LLVNSCDRSIDLTSYPLSECEIVNKSDRPIAVGVIGLATLYKKLGYSWEDEKARELNKKIFANMYYAALDESCNLAREHGPYDNYKGSPVSKSILQYEMCDSYPCQELDWSSLERRIKKYGVRNSLLIAPMPTASTSQCVDTGYSEGPFPDESNLMFRETTRGSFIYVE
ncbi:8962_t:CDS:1, partial [Racocetra persica]